MGVAYIFVAVHLLELFLEEFDYTVRVQHVLHTTGYSWVEVVLFVCVGVLRPSQQPGHVEPVR